MLAMKHTLGFHPAGGLWWIAFALSLVGGSITYMLSLDRTSPASHANAGLSLTITVVAVGICIICATSDWWMRR
jgi:hypothetical protein